MFQHTNSKTHRFDLGGVRLSVQVIEVTTVLQKGNITVFSRSLTKISTLTVDGMPKVTIDTVRKTVII